MEYSESRSEKVEILLDSSMNLFYKKEYSKALSCLDMILELEKVSEYDKILVLLKKGKINQHIHISEEKGSNAEYVSNYLSALELIDKILVNDPNNLEASLYKMDIYSIYPQAIEGIETLEVPFPFNHPVPISNTDPLKLKAAYVCMQRIDELMVLYPSNSFLIIWKLSCLNGILLDISDHTSDSVRFFSPFEEAMKIINQGLQKFPNDLNLLLIKFLRLKNNRQIEEAEETLEKFIPVISREHKKSYTTKKFYKFLSLDNYRDIIENIKSNKIIFTHFLSVNDPFEMFHFKNDDGICKEKLLLEYAPYISSFVRSESDITSNDIDSDVINPLLFSHYADKHRGICIEYEITDEIFECSDKLLYVPVKYNYDLGGGGFSDGFSIKYKSWEYENEGRFIIFEKHPDNVEYSNYTIGTEIKTQRKIGWRNIGEVSNIKKSRIKCSKGVKVKKIIFGFRTPIELRGKICKDLESREDILFSNAEIVSARSARLKFTDYSIALGEDRKRIFDKIDKISPP